MSAGGDAIGIWKALGQCCPEDAGRLIRDRVRFVMTAREVGEFREVGDGGALLTLCGLRVLVVPDTDDPTDPEFVDFTESG
jgi:hypothetical protein